MQLIWAFSNVRSNFEWYKKVDFFRVLHGLSVWGSKNTIDTPQALSQVLILIFCSQFFELASSLKRLCDINAITQGAKGQP